MRGREPEGDGRFGTAGTERGGFILCKFERVLRKEVGQQWVEHTRAIEAGRVVVVGAWMWCGICNRTRSTFGPRRVMRNIYSRHQPQRLRYNKRKEYTSDSTTSGDSNGNTKYRDM